MRNKSPPILYSFRRCPYAIRARLAIVSAKIEVEIREVLLRDKPIELIEVSKSKTVPCLITDKNIFDESLDIMIWALSQNDPDCWLEMPDEGYQIISIIDNEFKPYLDKTKYSSQYPKEDFHANRTKALNILLELEQHQRGRYFFGDKISLCDVAVFPFVRQFAFININWFHEINWINLDRWLRSFLESPIFILSQKKYSKWSPHQSVEYFP